MPPDEAEQWRVSWDEDATFRRVIRVMTVVQVSKAYGRRLRTSGVTSDQE